MWAMKRKTIRNHKDFLTEYDSPRVFSPHFIIKIKPAKIPGDARYGLIATKKTFKLAVWRNRAKRVLRDWIAYNEDLMNPDLDYIFILREPIINAVRDEGRLEMKKQLNKMSKIYSHNVSK